MSVTTETRELLELAALVAGVEWKQSSIDWDGLYLEGGALWRPHTDDGDCARMEAACTLVVSFHDGWVSVGHASLVGGQCEFYSEHDGDRNKARRTASLFAAASLGHNAGESKGGAA